jgi:hypothetical protein
MVEEEGMTVARSRRARSVGSAAISFAAVVAACSGRPLTVPVPVPDAAAFACASESPGLTYAGPCPAACPSPSSPCLVAGMHCEYGDDPRAPSCRTLAICKQGGWFVIQPYLGTGCEPLTAATDCPASSAAEGQACAREHSWCPLPAEGTACVCTTCDWAGGIFFAPCPAGKPRWQCLRRPSMLVDPRCPSLWPTLGTTCTGDPSCNYLCNPDGLRSCQDGVWTGGNSGNCPI